MWYGTRYNAVQHMVQCGMAHSTMRYSTWYNVVWHTVQKGRGFLNFLHYYQTFKILTFVGLCIVIYFYSKTNQMHNISNLFYFGTTLYMFWTVSLSIIRSLRLYIQHQVYVIQVLWLLASKQSQNLYDMYVPT